MRIIHSYKISIWLRRGGSCHTVAKHRKQAAALALVLHHTTTWKRVSSASCLEGILIVSQNAKRAQSNNVRGLTRIGGSQILEIAG
jgi:hypothetical protein